MTANDNNGRVFWLNGAQKVLLHICIALPLASQLKKFVNWPIKRFLFKMWPGWGTLFCQLFFISLSRVDLPRTFGRFLSFFLSFFLSDQSWPFSLFARSCFDLNLLPMPLRWRKRRTGTGRISLFPPFNFTPCFYIRLFVSRRGREGQRERERERERESHSIFPPSHKQRVVANNKRWLYMGASEAKCSRAAF